MSTVKSKVEVSVFQRAKEGNRCCGDSYFYEETDLGFICALADGLGSGKQAKESAEIVMDVIKNNCNVGLEKILERANARLIGKRGAVLGILHMDFNHGMYSCTSMGNIGLWSITGNGKKKQNIPSAGYLSGYKHAFKVKRERLFPNTNFIMFSDGVKHDELIELELCSNNSDTKSITEMYEKVCNKNRSDDTTLIAIRYHG